MTCKEALNTARAFSGKTHSEIADSMGIGTETVRRYHTDLDYNPPLPRVPELNRAYGNDILIQWLSRKCGGIFVRAEGIKSGAELQEEIAILTKEFSDVLSVHAEAIKDGKITKEEAVKLTKEAEELLIKAAEVLFAVKKGFQIEEGE
jgi:predicted transcriptional regulator